MARVQCKLCLTRCVSCKGGKCKCGMNTTQARKSNVIVGLGLEKRIFIDNDLFNEYLTLVKTNRTANEIYQYIVNNVDMLTIEEMELEKSKPRVIKQDDNAPRFCSFSSGGARMECKYCGAPRFYNKGKECLAFKK